MSTTQHPDHTLRRIAIAALLVLSLGLVVGLGHAPPAAFAAGPESAPISGDQVATGGAHTCAILDNGTVRCWGNNLYGQLGYGHTNNIGDNETPDTAGPVNLGTGRTATHITAGGSHTCAILDNGTVRCWGNNLYGQLGYGHTTNIGDGDTAGPVNLGTDRTATTIAAGAYHTCAILDNDDVRCWGYNDNGQLGYGHTNDIGDNETPDTAEPVNLGTDRTATTITTGGLHTCAILDNDTVRCWGYNVFGELGYGHTNDIGDDETPDTAGPVNLGTGRTATHITAGEAHTCAILDDDTVRCWGYNVFGELGYGHTNDIGDDETPDTAGPVNLGTGRTATAIAAGEYHTCAILDDGTVRCWGFNVFGQLGYGHNNHIGNDETPDAAGPVNLGTIRTATHITAGAYHTCAIADDGTVRCWGYNGFGQLGYGHTNHIGDDEAPASAGPVDLGTGRTATAITAGGDHTCAILDDGTVRCWGNNGGGRLGYGHTNHIGDNETPDTAGPVNLGTGRTATAITAGYLHACAVLDNGTVRCWGDNLYGQLGYGHINTIGDDETPDTAGPVNLGTGRTATAITAGYLHTCAILDNGTVRCWGNNLSGQLGYGHTNHIGDNETPDTAGPVNLGTGRTATAITAGYLHACAVLDNGTVRCWGDNLYGQLGYGHINTIGDDETPDTAGPVNLGTGRTATHITAGLDHTCVILDDGAVRCWGYNLYGQLGYGHNNRIGDDETPDTAGPVNLGTDRTATTITTGYFHTCAIADNDAVRCWGYNGFGQLGYGHTNQIGDDETPDTSAPVVLGIDSDLDTVDQTVDNCPHTPNTNQTNTDNADDGGDACDPDDDNDTITDGDDVCPLVSDPEQTNTDNADDGGDACDPDDDNDTIDDNNDNCPLATNTDQTDNDNDDTGDTCDPDDDNDTITDGDDVCPLVSDPEQTNTDNADDGGDACDPDDDNDTIDDNNDNCPLATNTDQTDLDNDGTGDACDRSLIASLTPLRLVDTRTAGTTVDGRHAAGGPLESDTVTEFAIAGRSSIPESARAAVLNLSVVDATGHGFLTIYPCGTRPLASAINYSPGQAANNEIVAQLSDNGTICIYAKTTAHLIIDATGATTGASPYLPITPTRLLDTRDDGENVIAGDTVLEVTIAGRGDIDDNARAAALNISTIDATGDGFLTVYPCGSRPLASSINFSTGPVVNNEIIAKLSNNGTICIYARTTTHVVIDAVGYVPDNADYTPHTPARLVDTRATGDTTDGQFEGDGAITGDTTYEVQITGRGGIPTDATTAVLNLSTVDSSGNGFLTIYDCNTQPLASGINYAADRVVNNEIITKLSDDGTICIYARTTTHLVIDATGSL